MSGQTGKAEGKILFAWLGILILAVFPLAFHSYADTTRFKMEAMLLMTTGMAFSAVCTFGYWRKGIRWKNLSRFLGLGYFVLTASSAFLGSMHDLSGPSGAVVWMGALRYEGMISQLCYGLIFLLMSMHPADIRKVMHGAVIGMVIYAGIVGLQYVGQNPLRLFPGGRSILTNYEFQGPLGNIDMVTVYLMIVIPLGILPYVLDGGREALRYMMLSIPGILLIMMMEVQSGLIALVVGACLLVCLGLRRPGCRARMSFVLMIACLCGALRSCIGLPWLDGTESVGFVWAHSYECIVFLVAAAGLMLLALLFRKHPGRQMAKKWLVTGLTGILILAVALIYFFPFSPGQGALYEMHAMLHGQFDDSFGSYRLGVWKQTLRMSMNALWFGTGPDTFYYAFGDYLKAQALSFPETFDTPHNLYLGILANHGLLALLGYLAMLICLIRKLARSNSTESMMLLGSCILYSVTSFFVFSLCLISPLAWCIFGMAAGLADNEEQTELGGHKDDQFITDKKQGQRSAPNDHAVSAADYSVSNASVTVSADRNEHDA